MMLLLVIFMLTAPMMTGGMDIKLPEADAKPIEASGGLTVSITKDGKIFLNDRPLSLSQFRSAFPLTASRSKDKTVKLQIDEAVTWGLQAQVISIINGAGITALGYVFNPTQEPPK
jgi:biopolymer transport protein ExbD